MDVFDQRLVKGAAGVVRWSRLDADGDAVAAQGTVTAGIVDANGDEILAPGQATDPDAGVHSLTVPASATAELGLWTVTFTDAGDGHTDTVLVDVCADRLVTIKHLRTLQPSLADAHRYPASRLRDEILAAEVELEWICDRAFTRRYARETLDGTGKVNLTLRHRDIASVVSVTVDGTALTSTEIAALTIDGKDIRRETGWAEGYSNVVIEYIHGWTAPPQPLVRAFALRIRLEVHQDANRIPERAERFSDDSGSYDLSTPGALDTGYPRVDGVYSRYSARKAKTSNADTGGQGSSSGVAAVSMPIDIDPTRDSLFHRRR